MCSVADGAVSSAAEPSTSSASGESLLGSTPTHFTGLVATPVLDAHALAAIAAWSPTPPKSPPTIWLMSLT
jgi:hypothetical protein